MIKKWYILPLLLPVAAMAEPAEPAATAPSPAAAEQQTPTPAEQLRRAIDYMVRDAALKESDRFAKEPSSAPAMFESCELVSRGIMEVKDYPWLPEVMKLYAVRKSGTPPTELLQMLLDAGADVNAVDERGLPALAYADKSPELCRYLLAAGMNPVLSECGRIGLLQIFLKDKTGELFGLLLEAGASFGQPEAHGDSALHMAALADNAEACRKLLESGVEVNMLSKPAKEKASSNTPLDYAVFSQSLAAAKVLSAAGGQVTDKEITPLYYACVMGDVETLRKLLAEGADPREAVRCYTPMEAAAYQGHEAVCAALLEAGVQPTEYAKSDDAKTTPLHAAAIGGQGAVCKLLIAAGAPVNARTARGRTPLHYAVQGGKRETVAELLAAGADANAADESGATPLMIAIVEGNVEMLRDLLSAGASPTAGGRSPLFLLVRLPEDKQAEVCRLLLEAGADPCACDYNGRTPLLLAIENQAPICEPLLSCTEALRVAGNDGKPPVLKALEANNPELCLRLIAAGALPEDDEEPGQQVFAEAVKGGHLDVCRALLAKGVQPKRWPALHLAALLGKADEVKALLAEGGRGASVKTRFKKHTALTYAARMGHAEVCRVLLEAGAGVNVRENDGWTPLIAAVDSGSAETCAVLLAAGADANVQHSGIPLLIIAVQNQYPEIARALIAAGAEVQDRDSADGRTALHWAAVTPGLGAVCECLIAAGVDPNAREANTQNTALHSAVEVSGELGVRSPIARRLIAAGVDATLKNEKGKTAEDLERKGCYQVFFSCRQRRPSF